MQGKIKFVAKTGGFKIEGNDDWFNPDDALKSRILQAKDSMKGLTYEIIVNGKGKVTELKHIPDGDTSAGFSSASEETIGTASPEASGSVALTHKDTLIIRQVCIKAACELKDDATTPEQIITIAQRFERYIGKGE